MMSSIAILALVIGIVAVSVWLRVYHQAEGFEADLGQNLPKTIWTYWDSENLPLSIRYCMSTWQLHNKDHTIVLLTNSNVKFFLPDFELSSFRHADSSARVSDCIRLNILAQYGGIWMDASIICNKPLAWVETEMKGKEFLGYYMNSFTKNPKYPVIESWFFACVPGSHFVVGWKDTFMRLNDYSTVQDYVDALKGWGTDPQDIPESLQNYLAIHMAAQYVLQVRKYPTANMVVLRCEDGPFKYLVDNEWNSEKAVRDVVEKHVNSNIIKLRGDDRKVFEKYLTASNQY